jgi:rhodanese-related sulfurtransferase
MTKSLDTKTLENWLKTGEVFLLDVREPDEYAQSSIKGSVLMPLQTVNLKQVKALNKENKKIAIHCRSGKRSLTACNMLLSEDPSLELYNVEGGITAWNETSK